MKTIAIVEDNADNRLLLTTILEDAYELVEYKDGRAAIDGIQRDPPDLVLLDISLPQVDGREVMRTLRKDDRFLEIPMIALTAHAMAGDRERLLEEGFDAYVSKPIVDDQELVALIDSLLASES